MKPSGYEQNDGPDLDALAAQVMTSHEFVPVTPPELRNIMARAPYSQRVLAVVVARQVWVHRADVQRWGV